MSGEKTSPAVGTWSEAEVRAALGTRTRSARQELLFKGVSTDSRAIQQGALFVALQGERFDGHDYLPAVAQAGARAALVRPGTPPVPGLVFFEVEDPLR